MIVSANFLRAFAKRRNVWMQAFVRRYALCPVLLALAVGGCSENGPATSDQSVPERDALPSAAVENFPPQQSEPTLKNAAPTVVAEAATMAEVPVDLGTIERRFLSAQNDPVARIAAIGELANVTPAAALIALNRLFPLEHREDVKGEMFTILSDLDHTKERDNQLVLCTKALARDQPSRIRYIAIHTMAELHDPRARALLLPLLNDPDGEIRAAAKQALSDLSE